MKRCLRPLVFALSLGLTANAWAQARKPAAPAKAPPTPATLAHNLGPNAEARLQSVVDRFNQETGSKLTLIRLEQGQAPATLNLVSRYQLGEIFVQPKQFVPLHEMMQKAGVPLRANDLSADLKSGVVDARGRLVALPVLYSTPVLFYNKNALRKAGLNPDQAPRTWFEMQGVLDKLQDAGYECPYTTSWPVWVHIDNVSAISGVPAATDKGLFSFNGLPQVKHVAMMSTWTKAGYFRLFGRLDEASHRFREGECAMITTDSREYADFQDAKGVELGVAPMPHHDDVYGGRRSSLADGPSLWVGAGKSKGEYTQAAKFVAFLLSPEMQVELVRTYGGLPLTPAARAAARSRLLQDGHQTLEVAQASLSASGPKPALRVANIDSARIIADEELEAVWSDKKPAKAALDTAVTRGNALLGARPALKKVHSF